MVCFEYLKGCHELLGMSSGGKYHVPVTAFISRFSSWKFNIRSRSEFPDWPVEESSVVGLRSPRLVARAESRPLCE